MAMKRRKSPVMDKVFALTQSGLPPEGIAEALGMTRGAVYIAQRRLEAAGRLQKTPKPPRRACDAGSVEYMDELERGRTARASGKLLQRLRDVYGIAGRAAA